MQWSEFQIQSHTVHKVNVVFKNYFKGFDMKKRILATEKHLQHNCKQLGPHYVYGGNWIAKKK